MCLLLHGWVNGYWQHHLWPLALFCGFNKLCWAQLSTFYCCSFHCSHTGQSDSTGPPHPITSTLKKGCIWFLMRLFYLWIYPTVKYSWLSGFLCHTMLLSHPPPPRWWCQGIEKHPCVRPQCLLNELDVTPCVAALLLANRRYRVLMELVHAYKKKTEKVKKWKKEDWRGIWLLSGLL